jgi:hypothetical protein
VTFTSILAGLRVTAKITLREVTVGVRLSVAQILNRRLKELFIPVVAVTGVGLVAGQSGMMAGMIGVRVGRSLVGKMVSICRVSLSLSLIHI